jgi:hypothetical protein
MSDTTDLAQHDAKLPDGNGAPPWLNLPEPRSFRPPVKHRTVWISDIHLGTRGCNAEMLVDFLKAIQCDTLYLVGDIIDGWKLRKGWYWPAAHNEVVRRILKMAHRGTRVVYVVGNHDEMLRGWHRGPHPLQHIPADPERRPRQQASEPDQWQGKYSSGRLYP